MKKSKFKIASIIFFSLTFILGLFSIIYTGQYEIVELRDSLLFSFKYFLTPSILFSSHLSYLAAFKYKQNLKKWFKIISFPIFLLPITLIYLSCFWWISLVFNSTIGHQEAISFNSEIIEVEQTNKDSILYITVKEKTDTIQLKINTTAYKKHINQNVFNETLKKGSLNFYYKK